MSSSRITRLRRHYALRSTAHLRVCSTKFRCVLVSYSEGHIISSESVNRKQKNIPKEYVESLLMAKIEEIADLQDKLSYDPGAEGHDAVSMHR
eukprot:SAG11_NODE_1031_length_6111_cov_2.587159_9_plen_93_part_00